MVILTVNKERCKGCELCIYACPKKILELGKDEPNSKGYYAAQITDMAACVACASCARVCPDAAIRIERS